jgi:hypothetical protein
LASSSISLDLDLVIGPVLAVASVAFALSVSWNT